MKNLKLLKKNPTKEKVKQQKSYEEQKKLKSLQNKISNSESKISALEREIKKLDDELESNYEETMAKPDFFVNYDSKKKQLQDALELWEELQLQIDELA